MSIETQQRPSKAKHEAKDGKAQPFAQNYGFYKLFWIFLIGCFLGVVVETIWCIVTRGHFESRKGLIYGPFNLVYGFGALAMSLGLRSAKDNRDSWVFLGGYLIGSVYENICSWLQEQMFGTVSWQYDHLPFNIHGRINLLYSIFWGILALAWVKAIEPATSRLIARIPNQIAKPLTWVLAVFMVLNTIVSGAAVARMAERREGIEAHSTVEKFLDERYPDERLEKIYPNMVYVE